MVKNGWFMGCSFFNFKFNTIKMTEDVKKSLACMRPTNRNSEIIQKYIVLDLYFELP